MVWNILLGEHGYKFNGIETKADTATLTAPIDGHNHPFVEHFKFLRDLVKDEDVVVKFTSLLHHNSISN